jgi:UDP-glucose 4-epimerase
MRVLVTGGAGFIGSHVVDAFIDAGHEVAVVDNLTGGRESNLNPKARFYKVDIRSTDLADVFAREKPEIVDHHAAQMDVRKSVADPLFDADVNVLGSLKLLELARTHGTKKVIYISTGGAVFGEPIYLPCDEDHPIDPICHYGVSKHIVEHYLHVYRYLYGLEYVVLRYPNVYGPRQNPHGEAGVVAIFTGRMLAGEPVTIFGSGEQARDFVYVRDCAQANVLAANSPKTAIYNLGSGEGTSVNLLFSQLSHIIEYSQAAQYGPARAGETSKIYLDSQRAQADLGWKMTVDLKQGLSETVEYFRTQERKG